MINVAVLNRHVATLHTAEGIEKKWDVESESSLMSSRKKVWGWNEIINWKWKYWCRMGHCKIICANEKFKSSIRGDQSHTIKGYIQLSGFIKTWYRNLKFMLSISNFRTLHQYVNKLSGWIKWKYSHLLLLNDLQFKITDFFKVFFNHNFVALSWKLKISYMIYRR